MRLEQLHLQYTSLSLKDAQSELQLNYRAVKKGYNNSIYSPHLQGQTYTKGNKSWGGKKPKPLYITYLSRKCGWEKRRWISYHAKSIATAMLCVSRGSSIPEVRGTLSHHLVETHLSFTIGKGGTARLPWLTHSYRQAREELGPEPRARVTPASGLNKESKIRTARSGPLFCSHLEEDINLFCNYLSCSSWRTLNIVLRFSCQMTRVKEGKKIVHCHLVSSTTNQ